MHRNETCNVPRTVSMSCPTHRSGWISKVDLEATHSSDDGNNGLDGVAVDHGLVLLTLLL